jgi:formylglycine-generating enzyme required for sulfatase activity
MKKNIAWLVIIVLVGAILSACNTQTQGYTVLPIRKIQTTATSSPVPIDETEPTASAIPESPASPTPEPTSMPELVEPTLMPTETVLPTIVATEMAVMGSTRISDVDQMEQVYVPAGEFNMGSSDIEAIQTTEGGRAYPEIPVNTVYLDGYWIDKYEVTNSQYALCVAAGACQPPFTSESLTIKNYYGNPEYANNPVVWVNWDMARTYCEWTGRRLPTEAEWEKAARGTDGRKYPWGNDPVSGERANLCDVNCPKSFANYNYNDGYADTAPVGSYPAGASAYGVMDMAGNVWEWTGTLIQPYPYDPNDGREDLEAPGERAWRGAAFSNGYWWMRASVRYRSVTFYWYYNLGIRCASSQ